MIEITAAQRQARRKNIRICHSKQRRDGASNGNWGGGSYVASDGYRYVRVLTDHGRTRYRLEHRLVVEEYLGRKLRREEQVHHRNGIKTDNRLANLQVLSVSEHARLHGRIKRT